MSTNKVGWQEKIPPIELRQQVVAARLAGKTPREVTEITGLGAPQARYLQNFKTEGTLVPATPSRSGPRNSTAKVSDEWLAALKKQCEEEPDLYDKERAAKLSQITGIQVSRQTICVWRWRLNITRKRKTTEYTDKEKEVNQKRAKKFLSGSSFPDWIHLLIKLCIN
jgi:transposase